MKTRPIAEGLFVETPAPRLLGGKHRENGRIVFPCPGGAEAGLYEPIRLSPRGRIWSYTVQRFRPKSPPYDGPEAFEAFVLAYVELPGEVIVEARIVDAGPEQVRIGAEVELVLIPFESRRAGGAVTMYAFKPIGSGAAA